MGSAVIERMQYCSDVRISIDNTVYQFRRKLNEKVFIIICSFCNVYVHGCIMFKS